MADPTSLQEELQAQLDYAALRNQAYTTYGKKLPKTRRAYARRLGNKIRKSQLAAAKPKLRFNAQGQPIYQPVPSMALDPSGTSYAGLADIVGRGAYRRRKKRTRGAYYANQVAGRGSFWNKGLQAARKGASWVRKHQHNIKAVGMAINPEMTMATDAFLKRTGAGKGAIRMLGRGAYNSLFPLETDGQLTEFDQVESEHGNLIVSGQEKIADIFGNPLKDGEPTDGTGKCVPFTSFTVNCTPGNFEQFPKLAQHAANFKEYEWISLIFTYKSTLPQNWQTTDVTTGKIIMATEYNLNKPVWTTHGELAAQEQKVEGPVTGITKAERTHTLGVECDPKMMTRRALKFVRTKGLTPDEEQQDYDLARVSFGMFGTNAALANEMIGELYVTYQVHFKTHRQYSMLGYNIPQSIKTNNFQGSSAGDLIWSADGSTNPDVWAQLYNFEQEGISRKLCYNNIDFELISTQVNWTVNTIRYDGLELKFTFPSSLKGNYEVEVQLVGRYLIPYDTSVEPDHDEGFHFSDSVLIPSIGGTALLNNDFPSEKNNDQRSVSSVFSDKKLSVRVHVHLEQATSVEDNTLSVNIPLLRQSGVIVEPNLYSSSDGNSPEYKSTMISVMQYNAFQNIGDSGQPYIDAVTKQSVTK